MHIVLFCATRRGLRLLQECGALVPQARFTVFSFREESWEPPFFEAIRDHAQQMGATFVETRSVGSPALAPLWESLSPDVALAVSWRYLIPAAIFTRPRFGSYVFHDSLLPAYRGFSPTVWAMLNGETCAGATLCEMVDAVDSGDIIDQMRVPIGPRATIAEVMEAVTDLYIQMLRRSLPNLCNGTAVKVPQDHTRASYTCKRMPEDNAIDWGKSSSSIHNLVRAVTRPYPGAFTMLNGRRLTVWSAALFHPLKRYIGRVPGRIVEVIPDAGVVVLTGDSSILVREVQLEGQSPGCASVLLSKVSYTLGR